MKSQTIIRVLSWTFLTILVVLLVWTIQFVLPGTEASESALLSESPLPTQGVGTQPVPATPSPFLEESPFPTGDPPAWQTYDAGIEQTNTYFETLHPETNTPGPRPTRPATLTPQPFIPGIYEVQPPIPAMEASMTNMWQGIVNEERVWVYAGAVKDHPGMGPEASQGVVFVETASTDFHNYDRQYHIAPITDTGVLTIIAETGYRLTLQAERGQVLYFDVPTRQFVDSLESTIDAPTATPLITIDPTRLTPEPIATLPEGAVPYP